MNLYETLEVEETATETEIDIKYRKLATKHHPDKKGGDTEEFKRITQAYEVLKDPLRRKQYDETGEIPNAATDNLGLSLALSLFEQLVGKVITSGKDPLKFDFMGEMKREIESQVKSLKKNIRENEKTKTKLESMVKRLGRKKKRGRKKKGETPQPNYFEKVILSHIPRVKNAITEENRKVEAYGEALEYVEQFEYKFDKTEPEQEWGETSFEIAMRRFVDSRAGTTAGWDQSDG